MTGTYNNRLERQFFLALRFIPVTFEGGKLDMERFAELFRKKKGYQIDGQKQTFPE